MPFAPHEIENKKFVVALRGYQTEEVDSFLRAVAADYRALLEATQSLSPDRVAAEIEEAKRAAREDALRDVAELRAAGEREVAALRDAAQEEADACFVEIGRQAEEVHRLQTLLWSRIHALEQTVVDARRSLATELVAMGAPPPGDDYRDGPSLAADTNVAAAIALR
ncbi:MAG TPA: DivIVA domain-containing protein [Gaiellaceae bacterium]|jgi:DivIVA domain-containing protein|nr:DivIVA domain-containing protein [Gaiellaceae bacterium]